MGRIAKLIGIVVGVVVLLFIAVLVAVGFLFDPNDYKDDITAAVARTTGRELTLDGDLTLALFPSIRIAVGSCDLEQRARLRRAAVRANRQRRAHVAHLAALVRQHRGRRGRLERTRAQPRARRARPQQLAGPRRLRRRSAPEAAPADGGASASQLSISTSAPSRSRMRASPGRTPLPAATGSSRASISRPKTSAPASGFRLSMSFELAGAQVQVAVEATTQATLVLADNAYRLEELEVQLTGSGPAWPGGEGEATVGFDSLAANLNAETVELSGLKLQFLGVTMLGSLSGQRLFSDLTLTGAVDIPQFNPRDTLAAFDVELETADSACSVARARKRTCCTTRCKSVYATCSSCSTTPR